MGETPDQIRDEIEETRVRMSETAEAIGYRADVPSPGEGVRGREEGLARGVDLRAGRTRSWARRTQLVARVGGIVPEGQELKDGAAKVAVSCARTRWA